MDRETLQTCLCEITVGVFEEAAFVFCQPDDENLTPDELVKEVTIQISGESQGSLMLSSSHGFGRTLAANLLGLDHDDEQAKIQEDDALSEILNMIAGAVSERCFGKQALCKIGIPKIQTVSKKEHLVHVQAADAVVNLLTDEDECIRIAAYSDEGTWVNQL